MPRIVCPSCGARYDVAAGMIAPPGRKVRCARCGTVWLARPEKAAEERPPQWPEPPPRVRKVGEEALRARAVPPPVAAPATADEEAPAPPAARPRGSGAAIGWAITLVLLAGAGYGAVAYAQAVIEAWPASARLYALLGIAP
jgi:predicted Zn finger-like uncharacterized protein